MTTNSVLDFEDEQMPQAAHLMPTEMFEQPPPSFEKLETFHEDNYAAAKLVPVTNSFGKWIVAFVAGLVLALYLGMQYLSPLLHETALLP